MTPRLPTQILLATAALLALATAPGAQAAPPVVAGGSAAQHCADYNIVKVVALINAGTVEVCIDYDAEVPFSNSQWQLVARAAGPDNGAGALTYTWANSGLVGCTLGTPTTTTTQGLFGSDSNYQALVTMTASHCTGLITLTLAQGATTIVTSVMNFNTEVMLTHDCSNDMTQCAVDAKDVLQRTCGATAYGTPCVDAQVRTYLCDASQASPLAPANCSQVLPTYLSRAGFVLSVGLLLLGAIVLSRLPEPPANFFGAVLAMMAGFRAFDTSAGLAATAAVIVASFTLFAWCTISGAIRMLNGAPLFPARTKKDNTEL